jgi:shikimate kinase
MIVLIGPPGSGKSTVGKLLAERLGVSFADTDAMAEQAAGKPAGDIFVEDGEEAFRQLERSAVQRAMDGEPGVLALGSGAVLDPGVREQVAGLRVVYLRAGFAAVAKRSGLDRPRVVLPGNPRGMLRTMLAEREPVYESLATETVPSDELSPEEIVERLS